MILGSALVVGGGRLDSAGGVETVCRAEAGALSEAGLRVTYLSSAGTFGESFLHRLPGRRLWASPAEVVLTAKKAASRQWDVVITNGPVGWGIRGNVVTAHMYHGTFIGQAESVRGLISGRGRAKLRYVDGFLLERHAGRQKRCLANSTQTAAEVAEWFGYQSEVVWCPIDTDRFVPSDQDDSWPLEFGARSSAQLGLFVGGGRPMKGGDVAFEVMRRLPDVRWLVAGRCRVPPNATVIDSIEPVRMPALLRSVDVLLMPSRYEPFGILGAEALASGTPVVVGPSGLSEWLTAEGGPHRWSLPSVEDAGEVTRGVERTLADPRASRDEAMRLRKRIVKELSVEVWAQHFLKMAGVV